MLEMKKGIFYINKFYYFFVTYINNSVNNIIYCLKILL